MPHRLHLPEYLTAIALAWLLALAGCQHGTGNAETGEPWVRTELYFGLNRPNGVRVSDAEWQDFLNRSVTPRFPEGLTVVQGQGRFRSQDQQLHEEATNLLIILHPKNRLPEADQKIRDLCAEYIRRFEQESVLRSDSVSWASFITGSKQGIIQEPAEGMGSRKLSK